MKLLKIKYTLLTEKSSIIGWFNLYKKIIHVTAFGKNMTRFTSDIWRVTIVATISNFEFSCFVLISSNDYASIYGVSYYSKTIDTILIKKKPHNTIEQIKTEIASYLINFFLALAADTIL